MDTSTLELTIRMLIGLAVIGGLLYVINRTARNRLGRGGGIDLEVCGRQALTRSSSVAVVRVGERHLLLGVNDHAVTLLTEGDDLLAATRGGDPVVDVRSGGRAARPTRAKVVASATPGAAPTPSNASEGLLGRLQAMTVRKT
ncbi:MAG: flagellar biosynthetic protein FliO [Actinomycetota bacterium]